MSKKFDASTIEFKHGDLVMHKDLFYVGVKFKVQQYKTLFAQHPDAGRSLKQYRITSGRVDIWVSELLLKAFYE